MGENPMNEGPLSPDYEARFAGIARLYGRAALCALQRARFTVIGLGGVGSWTVEALARSGVGHLNLVDLDEICLSNTNRQLHTTVETLGHSKVAVLASRARAINPEIEVDLVEDFFTATSGARILEAHTHVVVDAIDQFSHKCLLLEGCRERGLPCVVVGGAGGRVDPTRVAIDDMSKTRGDKLLAMMRKRLRQKHGFPRSGSWDVPCVYSDEPRRYPGANGTICDVRPDTSPMRLDCAAGFGAATFVTGTFGFMAAKAAIDLYLEQ